MALNLFFAFIVYKLTISVTAMTYLMLGHQLLVMELILREHSDSDSRGKEGLQQDRLWALSCAAVYCTVSVLFCLFVGL